jgi:hypothetical protein
MGDGTVFLNDDRTRKALHAPTSKDWALQFPFVFGDPTGKFSLSLNGACVDQYHLVQLLILVSRFPRFLRKASEHHKFD